MTQPSDAPQKNPVPLCVDLDGTLIKTDLLWELFVRLLKRNPLWLLAMLAWWLRGRAHLKRQLARRVTVDPATLPYHEAFLAFLREERRAGRKLILATASDREMAMPVANYLGLFDEVLGSDGKTNLRSGRKLKLLTDRFGERGFDYAGNSSADIAVWRGARSVIVVNADRWLVRLMERRADRVRVFAQDSSFLAALGRALRPGEWVKNGIIFAPVIAAHRLNDSTPVLFDGVAFASFCLCASGGCLVKDLLDLDADRRDDVTTNNPLASGDLPLPTGLVLGPLLLLGGLGLAAGVSWLFAAVTAAYLVLGACHSWWARRVGVLEVLCLAGLYMIRLAAGQVAGGIPGSCWPLTSAMCIFLNLALATKYAELACADQTRPSEAAADGRGQLRRDREVVMALGITSGFLAALAPALYVNSAKVFTLYAHPDLLFLLCPLLLAWMSRVWLLAHRGQLHDDPLVFTAKDGTSRLLGAMALADVWLAAVQ
jgi:4-hydroxybenzoate polyprenyltransferase/phosphoserine phosphatase